jgi:hypothetical protein
MHFAWPDHGMLARVQELQLKHAAGLMAPAADYLGPLFAWDGQQLTVLTTSCHAPNVKHPGGGIMQRVAGTDHANLTLLADVTSLRKPAEVMASQLKHCFE